LRTYGVAVTVFGCGWVLMGLEILGGRMLSPDFSSGVWGSVISVFLAALATGYFVGGLLSQRFPHALGLAIVIIIAAIWLIPVAIWHRQASGWFAGLCLRRRPDQQANRRVERSVVCQCQRAKISCGAVVA